MMIAHLLQRSRYRRTVRTGGSIIDVGVGRMEHGGRRIGAAFRHVENVSAAQVRYAVRRIRRRIADAGIVAALLWDADDANDRGVLSEVRVLHTLRQQPRSTRFSASAPDQPARPPVLSLEVREWLRLTVKNSHRGTGGHSQLQSEASSPGTLQNPACPYGLRRMRPAALAFSAPRPRAARKFVKEE